MDERFNSTDQMRQAVFLDGGLGGGRYSRFWLLLVLATVIASAGVIGDSTATVIGAMIVAPLMTPIIGTMLATVLGDRDNLVRSMLLVILGAVAAIAVGFAVGLLDVNPVVAATNSQVAARVSPSLIDLLAALGTGVVGSIALVRKDLSETLSGVAIAISLVPPLAVVGLTLESGAPLEALGALLLFLTNVVAIIGTGIVVMSVYGVTKLSRTEQGAVARRSLRRPIALLAVMGVLIGAPLALTSFDVALRTILEQGAQQAADRWAADAGWTITEVSADGDDIEVRAEGPLPVPDTLQLEALLAEAGLDPAGITVTLVPVHIVELGSGSN